MVNRDLGSGFSLNAIVRIEGADRSGLERLLRYCARTAFAPFRAGVKLTVNIASM
jgi:hypothetical protein